MFPATRTRTNEEWLHDLREGGTAQEPAIADLQHLLFRAVLYIFNRHTGDLGALGRDDILTLAEDCSQEALIAILSHPSDFRGDSKFTTWAYTFAVNIALLTARRERWRVYRSINYLPQKIVAFLSGRYWKSHPGQRLINLLCRTR